MAPVDAIWRGPFGYTLPDGTQLEPGITVCKVPEFEANESDNWQPVVPTSESTTTATGRGADADAGEDE